METETQNEGTMAQPRIRPRPVDGGPGSAPAAQPASTPATGVRGAGIALGPRDLIQGKLVYEGDLRVQGTLEGEATVSGDLSVEGQGTVRAKVEARNLAVRGTLDGEASVHERLLIAGSGSVQGNVRVARLAIEDGGVLNGNVTMEKKEPGNTRPRGEAATG
ncbi:MAG: polymer-forming cytoskeletal protein [Candidatus Dormibacteraeota bacterium]|nr:polymer-forming cytoskeletal protein [Candidatus Dormibacteraeota bacterium]MDQ6921190.1 polymer-forming cytoskeletal protein [Candidatus Dormibacteraeota bacterium]